MDTGVRNMISFLAEECGWPIDEDEIDFTTWSVDNAQIGLNDKVSIDQVQVYELRPLTAAQPWGVFFLSVDGTSKLSVTLLRRLLRGLVLKKRTSADTSHLQQWNLADLMFVCTLNESNKTTQYFAHFKEQESGLPKLFIGSKWDDSQPKQQIEIAKSRLKSNLRWPDDENDLPLWRINWSKAFILAHREVIKSSEALSIEMANIAKKIRAKLHDNYDIEAETGPVNTLFESFKDGLIRDLDFNYFADMIAQTITYGLFSARTNLNRLTGIEDLSDNFPTSNSFLKQLFEEFSILSNKGHNSLDFDDMGVGDLIEMLNNCKINEIIEEFGTQFDGGKGDPIIHFYEKFLKSYDKKIKVNRGVFYTPKPVVSSIIRTLDYKLTEDYNLEDGLADTSTWGDIIERFPNISVPDGISLTEPFVQILDPATGTGTFMVEVFSYIYEKLVGKWKDIGKTPNQIKSSWNAYLSKHLLKVFTSYELMMTPFVIAHMKVNLFLKQTGYTGNEDVRIFLTNTLESPKPVETWVPDYLANQSISVNNSKLKSKFTVILGNPPYSGRSWNLSDEVKLIVEPYKYIEGKKIKERGALQLEKNIQEDYIKFISFAEQKILETGCGIIGYVISHGILDNITLRGARYSLMKTFNDITLLDMHGNISRTAISPLGDKDENVFDIKKTGALVLILSKSPGVNINSSRIFHTELWGSRLSKYAWLNTNFLDNANCSEIIPLGPNYLFIPEDTELKMEFEKGPSFAEMFSVYSNGLVSGRDKFVIDFNKESLIKRISIFANLEVSNQEIENLYGLKSRSWWDLDRSRQRISVIKNHDIHIRKINYRLFDSRYCYYYKPVFESLRRPVVKHLEEVKENILFLTTKMTKGESFAHIFCSKLMNEAIILSPKTSNNANAFPLYLSEKGSRVSNIKKSYIYCIKSHLGAIGSEAINAENIADYIYGILHSDLYRSRYKDFLGRSFPRIPITNDLDLFNSISELGNSLIQIHLLNFDNFTKRFTNPGGEDKITIEKYSYSDNTIWINEKATVGFQKVPIDVWKFKIGGYNVCEKWLKSRQRKKGKSFQGGQVLNEEDIIHYEKVIAAVEQTCILMKKIDDAIGNKGGYPIIGSASFTIPGDDFDPYQKKLF